MSYGETIRFLRIKAGMSQGDLARRIGRGITNQSVSGWERGKAAPSRENLLELARIFGVGADDIMEQEGIPTSERPPAPSASVLFAAVEEAFLQAQISREAAQEIAEAVELAVTHLRVPQGMTAEAAIRRIMRFEVPDILARKR